MKKSELQNMTVAELRTLARKKGVAITLRLKADIVDEVQRGLRRLEAAAKRKKAAPKKVKKTSPKTARPAMKSRVPTKKEALGLMKRDLEVMTVSALRETAKKLGLRSSFSKKDELVSDLALGLRRLRAEAKKAVAKAAPKTLKKSAPKTAPKAAKKATPKPEKKATPKAAKKADAKPVKKTAAKKKTSKQLPVSPASSRAKAKRAGKSADVTVKKVKPVPPVKEEITSDVPSLSELLRSGFPEVQRKEHHVMGAVPPRTPAVAPDESGLPAVEMVAAIAIEPTELFISWELSEDNVPQGDRVLRVFERSKAVSGHFDIPMFGLAGSVYARVHPGMQYRVEAGAVDDEGRFMSARSSNTVSTPPGGPQPLPPNEPGSGERALPEEYFTFIPPRYGSK